MFCFVLREAYIHTQGCKITYKIKAQEYFYFYAGIFILSNK